MKAQDFQFTALLSLKESGVLSQAEIETKITLPMIQIYDYLAKTLRKNNVIMEESEATASKVETMVATIMKIQSTYIAQSKSEKFNIQGIIRSMKPEIEESVGAVVCQEIEGLLGRMTGMLEDSFG